MWQWFCVWQYNNAKKHISFLSFGTSHPVCLLCFSYLSSTFFIPCMKYWYKLLEEIKNCKQECNENKTKISSQNTLTRLGYTVKKVNINCRWYYSCPLFTHFKSIKHWCLNSLLWMFLFWLKTSASDANTIYHQLKSPSVNVWHHLPINSVVLM